MKNVWIKANLYFARFLAGALVCGLLWGWGYIGSLNSKWIGYPTVCGIFCICICLTAIVLILNVIVNIIMDRKAEDLSEKENVQQQALM